MLDLIGLACSLFVVVLSASTTPFQYNRSRLIGLIAGSFAAGVTLANAMRNRPAPRARVREAASANRRSDSREEKELDYEELFETYNPGDIAITKSILNDAGISHYFRDENFATMSGPLVQPARLMVPKAEAAEARMLLKDLKLSIKGINVPDKERKR